MRTSFQLYSARDHVSLPATLALLSDLGYTRVEGYGTLFDDLPALERGLKDTGLEMTSSHIGLDMLESDPDRAINTARSLGLEMVFAPFLAPEDRPQDAAGWQALAKRLSVVGSRMADAGITFGWHNHEFELMPLADGSVPLDVILEHAPNIAWQADLAWVARADVDPRAVTERYLDRIVSLHVKDIAPIGECLDEDGWADPGKGSMPWDALLATLGSARTQPLYVAEHDKPSDTVRFAQNARAFFVQHGAQS